MFSSYHPKNAPTAFLQAHLESNSKLPSIFGTSSVLVGSLKRVVCIGDSITAGMVNPNYVDLLAQHVSGQSYAFINAGINGDLVFNVLQRCDQIIQCQPDFISILIGTNDVNASLSEKNIRRFMKDKKLPCRPTHPWFREMYSALLQKLQTETHAQIALISMPTIGETPSELCYTQTIAYSQTIKELAAENNLKYIPLNEDMNEAILNQPLTQRFSYNEWMKTGIISVLKHFIFRKNFDQVGTANGFQFHSDYIHINSRTANMIVKFIASFLP